MKFNSFRYSKKSLWLPIAMILIIAAMVPIITGEINKSGTYFSVIPERNIVEANCTDFTVDINITNAKTYTYAWELYLGYDPSVLTFLYANESTWLSDVNINTTFTVKPMTNYVGISCYFFGPVSPGAKDNGRLCNVTFHVDDDTGFTKLNLYDTSLIDMEGDRSYYPNNDGFFEGASVATLHDVAITDVTVSDTEVAQGDSVVVTVYIENEGTETQTVNITVYAERLTHNPEDQDEVWVGDLGSKDRASGDPNWRTRPEYFIGENNSISIGPVPGTDSSSFTWNTANVAGETYKICAVLEKTGDDDWDDNEFIGPEVHVVSTHDLKLADVEVLTPEVDKSNGIPGAVPAQTRIVMNFSAPSGNITSIMPCDNFTATSMHQRVGLNLWAPRPSTWWEVIGVGVQFHVDWSNETSHEFHIDQVLPTPIPPGIINQAWLMAEQVGKIAVTVKNEGTVKETADVYVFAEDPLIVLNFSWLSGPDTNMLKACNLYTNNTKVFPMPCSWWHIIWPEELACKEFHVSDIDWNPATGTFHIDFVWPDPEPIPTPFVLAQLEHIVDVQPVTLEPWTNATHSSKTLHFTWNVTGNYIADPTQIHPGEYTIKALVKPVVDEEPKNWFDNKWIDGTIKVVVYDVAVVSVKVLDVCNIAGLNPVVRIRATLINLGSELVKVNIYFIATDNLANPKDTSRYIVFGLSIGVSTIPGEPPKVIETMAPYGGWNTKMQSLMYTSLKPVPGTTYLILANIGPYVGRDNNPTNDANVAVWKLPSSLDTMTLHDVEGFSGWLGTDAAWYNGVENKKPIELRMNEFYCGCPLIIDVNVVSYAEYPLYGENVNVDLFYRDDTTTTTFVEQGPAPVSEIKNCTWYTVIAGATPTVCSWWHIISPDALYSIEFHVDQVSGSDFHIDKVMVSGNITDVILTTPVQNATAEKEVPIGTQTVSGLAAMQIMAFFNETFPATGAEIVEISSKTWYVYNFTWGGETYGNLPTAPSAGTWFELKLPVYGFMIHIDQVQKVQPGGVGTPFWYKIHLDKVGYYDIAKKRFVERNATGYPLPKIAELAWRMQPKTATFTLCTGPGTPFDTPRVWYSIDLVAHLTLLGVTDVDPCDNKCTGFASFKLRCPWGDVNNDEKVSLADVGKLDLAYSKQPPFPAPPYDVYRPELYLPFMPDVNGDGKISLADVGKLDLLYSGVPINPPCGAACTCPP